MMQRVPTVFNTGMPVRLTEKESNNIPLQLHVQSVKPSIVVDVLF